MFDWVLAQDEFLRTWLATHGHAPWLDAIMLGLSAIGDHSGIWLFTGAALLIWAPERVGAGVWRLVLTLGLAGLLVDAAIKPLVGRERPFVAEADTRVIGERPDTHSFPSGHASGAGAGAATLSRIWRRRRALWWTLAVGIATSRVYLGVHYPLDVVAGLLIGYACYRFVHAGVPQVSAATIREPAV